MSRIDQIKKQLNLPSKAQTAWTSLSTKERKVFIMLANLDEFESELIRNQFDRFSATFQNKLSKAIRLASKIAKKFNAQLKPVSLSSTKELRAA